MKTYQIKRYFTTFDLINVEAEDEEEAVIITNENFDNPKPQMNDIMNNLEFYEAEIVEE